MVTTVLLRVLAVLSAAALVLTGCGDYGGGDGNGETTPPVTESPTETTTETTTGEKPGAVTITIENFDFGADVTVKAGQQFTVTNSDGVGHTFTADDGEFDVPVGAGESKTVTIDKAGSYPFHCTPHPQMTGTITVE